MSKYLIYGVDFIVDVLQLMLFVRALLSWFVTDINSGIGRFYESLVSLTEFLVMPVRKLLNRFLGQSRLDWSVLVVFFLIRIVGNLLISLLSLIF